MTDTFISPENLAPGQLIPAFTATPDPDDRQTYQFTDTSTGNVATWAWDFGDGSTSTTQNPVKHYVTAGQYTVTLTVTNPSGKKGRATSSVISVNTEHPVVDFTWDVASGSQDYSRQLTDLSSPTPDRWFWIMVHGGETFYSNEQNPLSWVNGDGIDLCVTLVASYGNVQYAKSHVVVNHLPDSSPFQGKNPN